MGVRSAGVANTSRVPAPRPARAAETLRPPPPADGRAATPKRTSSAEAPNVAASASRQGRAPSRPVSAPPAAKPITWASWLVVSVMAVPVVYRSPARITG